MTTAWTPETIEALEAAVRDGVLVEGHHVDFKRELATGTAGNKGLAKDLAAFAVDGGQIIIGVDEDGDGPPTVRPFQLAGLKERVDQIARSAVTPPLAVRCVELPTPEDSTQGCLLVVVPPSPAAPHQAAERLWGRSDTTNYVLPPSEVGALYERRALRRADIEALLDGEIARDPTPEDLRQLGHLFVVAQPESADDEMFFRALTEQNFSTWVHKTLLPKLFTSRWAPDIATVGSSSRRARGWAVHDYCISEERAVRPNGEQPARENHLLDMEVHEDGGVRLFSARATDIRNDAVKFVDIVVSGLILRVVETACTVADTASFRGSWHFGVALTNIRGAVSHEASQNLMASPTRFSEDTYRRVGAATYEEIMTDVVGVASKLAAPLLRAFQSPFDLRSLHRS
jgi:hypothetical protein